MTRTWRSVLGWVLIWTSALLWLAMFAIPLATRDIASIVAWTGAVFVLAEVLFWLGLVILGSAVAASLKWISLPFMGHHAAAKASVMKAAPMHSKTYAIFGASGGLGSAIAEELRRQDAHVIPVVRKIYQAAGMNVVQLDLLRPDTLEAGISVLPELDGAIFATGIDLRAPLATHTDEDISRQIRSTLEGPILATRMLLEKMRPGAVIAHIGGFGDGRLALPYHSVNVAARAGLAAFCEAVTREMAAEGRDIIVSYLCPEPADTLAERPFHDLWLRMGSTIYSPDAVAQFVRDAVKRRAPHAVMGHTTWLLAKINAISPGIADALALRGIGKILRESLGSSEQGPKPPSASSGSVTEH